MFIEYGFCIITFVSKSLAWGYAFNCIRPMLNFLELGDVSHREQWKNLKLAGKAWTENFAVQRPVKNFVTVLHGSLT